jgi:hypothetical protein
MLPFPQYGVLRHAIAVRVLDSNEMKAPLLGIKRLNGCDEPPPVPDGGQHTGTWVLNGLGRKHLVFAMCAQVLNLLFSANRWGSGEAAADRIRRGLVVY